MTTETITTYAGAFIDGREHTQPRRPRCPSPTRRTGQAFAEVPAGTEAGRRRRRASRGRGAFGEWSELGRQSKRGEILGRAAHHVEEHLDELIPLLTREQGKTLRDSRIEITKAIDTLMHYAGLSKALRGAHTPNLDPGVDGIVLRRPLGVVGAIVPWNFPTTLLSNKLAPALVAGNTVVAKPAGTTPLTTLRFAELLAEGGLPPGVFNVVTGSGSLTGTALVTHPGVRKIAFTGSTPVGEQIMALAARGTKRVTLELGGSDPMIICDDADLDAAASAASMGRFYNCGQACLAIKRVYVFESVADQVIEQVTAKAGGSRSGAATSQGSQMGPLHTAAAARRGRRPGGAHAGTVAGRSPPAARRPEDPDLADGFFYMPTVVVDPPHDSPMATEEVFGPALPIWRVRDLDEAIERANASQFGLGSSVWTRDLRPRAAGRRADRGRLHVDQLAHQGLRRAALRRLEVQRLRQGARRGGLRLLHRDEVGGRQRSRDDALAVGPGRAPATR